MNHYNMHDQLSYISLMAVTRLRKGVFDIAAKPWVASNQVDVIERCVDRFFAMQERERWLTDASGIRILAPSGRPVVQSPMAWIDEGGTLGEQALAIEGYLRAEAGAEYAEYRLHENERRSGIPGGGPSTHVSFLIPIKSRTAMVDSLRDAFCIESWQRSSAIAEIG